MYEPFAITAHASLKPCRTSFYVHLGVGFLYRDHFLFLGVSRSPNPPTVACSAESDDNVIDSSDGSDDDFVEIQPLVDRRGKRKKGAGSRHPKPLQVSARQGGGDLVPPHGGYNSSWPWYTSEWMAPQPTHAVPPWPPCPPMQPYPVPWSGCASGDPYETEDRQRKRKKRGTEDIAVEDSSPGVLKPCKVIVYEGGEVDAACSGKNAWDQAVRTFIPKTMDLSVVEWLQQKPKAVKKLRALLDNEFQYVGRPLSMTGFRTCITRYMKSERSRLKAKWLKWRETAVDKKPEAEKAMCPITVKTDQWERLLAYWKTVAQQMKSKKMALTQQSVKNTNFIGRKGKSAKEVAIVSFSLRNACQPLPAVHLVPLLK